MRLKNRFLPCGVIVLAAILAGCASNQAQDARSSNHPVASASDSDGDSGDDPLYVSDKVTIQFSNTPEPIPNIEQEIKDDGTIRLPDIGSVKAVGKTPGQLERDIEKAYVPAYYTHISVTVTPSMRFFYVGGQVNQGVGNGGGGRFPYSGPITVTQAIYAAGDFTPFADRKRVRLTRRKDRKVIIVNCVEALKHPEKDVPVYPGDRIDVPRRWF